MDADPRTPPTDPLPHLADLPARLAGALGADELVAATEQPADAGITRRIEPDELWVGARRLPSPIPRVMLELGAAVDARALCDAWGVDRPVAISGDVHQRTWAVVVAGAELPDPYGRRIATTPFGAGRWDLRIDLLDRPAGPLPGLVAGASPAYDVREAGGAVRQIEVTRSPRRADVVAAGDTDARLLLASMAAQHPSWHAGWEVDRAAEFVVVRVDDRPIAGAALALDGPGEALASRVCVEPEAAGGDAGSALLDVLQALAIDRGCARLRLDDSVFLHPSAVPFARHGFVVGPPYDGDADVPTWADRDLRSTRPRGAAG